MTAPPLITEAQVRELLTMEQAIDVLDDAYAASARDEAASMPRAQLRTGDRILHAVGGSLLDAGVVGTKTWLYTPEGASPLLVLFSLHDGSPLALVEAFALGQFRTAATSGLGTRLLARPDARRLALLGTGKQALPQARAVCTVRPIDHVALFGRDARRRASLARLLQDTLGVTVSEHADARDALAGADVVTTVTRTREPIVEGHMLEPGVHVNAVGAITPGAREIDADAVARFDVVVADSVVQARSDAAELKAAVDAGLLQWDRVRQLAAFVEGDEPARRPEARTLFKALGLGLSDVALGRHVVSRALDAGAVNNSMTLSSSRGARE